MGSIETTREAILTPAQDNLQAEAVPHRLAEPFFPGGGEMGSLLRTTNWSNSLLGPPQEWSPALRMMANFLLANRFPQLLWWGPQFCSLYNDAYIPILGAKHPWALGQPVSKVWSEIWDVLKPLIETPFRGGPATWMEDIPLEINRRGFFEETHFTVAYSPVPDDTAPGGIGGVLATVHEITDKVIGERRVRALRELGARSAEHRSAEEACGIVGHTLSSFPCDIPFLLLYLADEKQPIARLACCIGADPNDRACPRAIDLASGSRAAWPLFRASATEEMQLVENLRVRFEHPPQGPWSEAPHTAAVVPIRSNLQHRLAGFMVAGISSRIPFDQSYRDFLELLSTQIAAMIANARAYEQERRRSEALAELDRAKTLFFSNISHELRTPLTLLLGPTESALASREPALKGADLEMLHRNELRLLKLVNTLLDFSRIEAGRVQAVFEPTDLDRLTADIASAFRSAMERAGLQFTVDCKHLAEPVYVDREMWEKIVLNLLSNAFKFTVSGEVALTLRNRGHQVELSVRDTGSGIPQEELPRVFERFHRVESTRARTHEGTGIGLALVQELVRLHGGAVTVESQLDHGATFRVTIPKGADHLPASQIGARRTQSSTALGGDAYVEEALLWLSDEKVIPVPEHPAAIYGAPPHTAQNERTADREVVLVADDNADMRAYVARLLAPVYQVHTAPDGAAAIEMAARLHPALILTDVMMPGVDGFGVLRAVRGDPALRNIPVIMLSARAGEEAHVEGLDAGADDYLVKPFTAREMLARIAAHLRIARLRAEAATRESRLRAEAELERGRLAELLAQIPAAVGLLTGPEHRWSYVNDACVRTSGRTSPADFIGKTVLESLPELEDQGFMQLLDRVRETGNPYLGCEALARINRGPHGESQEAWFDFSYHPVRDLDGAVTGILVHGFEVTDRVLARRALIESERRFRALATASAQSIYRMSPDWSEMHQLKGGGFLADTQSLNLRWMDDYIFPEDRLVVRAAIEKAIRTRKIFELEHRVRRADGSEGWVMSRAVPIFDDQDQVMEWFGAASDITERMLSRRMLRITERLASVGKLAATIAHEINNPLEALANLLYLARESDDTRQARVFLAQAEQELSRVALLTRQTLGFSRETPRAGPLRVGVTLESALALFSPKARDKQVHIHTEIRRDPEIRGVESEIRRLIANLLNNSIDATDRGGAIRMRISPARSWRSGGESGVRFTIADTGAGIAPPYLLRIFEPFFTTKKDVGTGLGLWISKGIVDHHNGSISVKSSVRPGRTGTVFSIYLPAQSPLHPS